jgi:hypothetical protein
MLLHADGKRLLSIITCSQHIMLLHADGFFGTGSSNGIA